MSRATFLTGLLMAAAVMTVAGSAAAQIGSHRSEASVPEGSGLSQEDQARETLVQYSACTLRTKRKQALEAIGLFPDAVANSVISKLATNDCLAQGEMYFNPRLFRGALFIVLYRQQFGRGLPAIPESVVDFSAGSSPPLSSMDDQMIALMEFGDCVVRADPATAHAIVTAKVGSAEETRLFKVIAPRLGPCLYEGQQVTFSKTVLTGVFAEALYRDATQASAPVSAGKD